MLRDDNTLAVERWAPELDANGKHKVLKVSIFLMNGANNYLPKIDENMKIGGVVFASKKIRWEQS